MNRPQEAVNGSKYAANTRDPGDNAGPPLELNAEATGVDEYRSDSLSRIISPLLEFITPGYNSLFMKFLETAGELGKEAVKNVESNTRGAYIDGGQEVAKIRVVPPSKTNDDQKSLGGAIIPRKERYIIEDKLLEEGTNPSISWLDKYLETLWWSQLPICREDMAIFRDIGREHSALSLE